MAKRLVPGIDPSISPRQGVSRDGQPLSHSRLPADDLSPWIAWLYATSVAMPADYELSCSLFNDTAMIRVQLDGDWRAETRDGPQRNTRAALYFGAQSRAMPVSVRGSFISIGMALKPGAGYAVTGKSAAEFLDRIVPCEEVGLPVAAAFALLDPAATPETWLDTLENVARAFLCGARFPEPEPISARFERLALADPGASVAEFAEANAISQRQLERICRRDFGLPPKQVLRRARAIDMASHLRGVADSAEAEELALRYYDQSHMIRDFTDLFGMSPRQFATTPQPLMTLALESRQTRRLAVLERLPPGGGKPWE